jgi:uncharacterized repeat protein (TIGR01451 family)
MHDMSAEAAFELLAGKDLMVWLVNMEMDTPEDMLGPDSDWCVGPGLIEVMNGTVMGTWLKCNEDFGAWEDNLLGGTFHTNLAAEPGRAIPDEHIQSGSVTVKQIEVGDADLQVVKKEITEGPYDIGDQVTFGVTVTNLGPAAASSIWVDDLLPAELSLESWDATMGFYYSMSSSWNVGDLDVDGSASLTIYAEAVAAGEDVCNLAFVSHADQHDPVAGNNADEVCFTIVPPDEPEPITCIDLELGWNFVSWPLIPDIQTLPTTGGPYPADPHVLSGLENMDDNVDVVWGNFDPVAGADPGAALEDIWQRWDPEDLDPSLLVMADGVGFWINMLTAGHQICVEGQEVPDPPMVPPAYDVVGGEGGYWNVVAFKSTSPKLPEVYLAGIAGKFTIIYGFDNGEYFIVGTEGHLFLEPGQAYWIAVLESGKIFP